MKPITERLREFEELEAINKNRPYPIHPRDYPQQLIELAREMHGLLVSCGQRLQEAEGELPVKGVFHYQLLATISKLQKAGII